jgi:hypothetical protein
MPYLLGPSLSLPGPVIFFIHSDKLDFDWGDPPLLFPRVTDLPAPLYLAQWVEMPLQLIVFKPRL